MFNNSLVSIILPTYNEAGNIDKLIKTLIDQLKFMGLSLKIIVVDDNSPDGTADKVSQLIDQKLPVKLFIRKNQRGLATAILHGITHSTGKIIVIMDTDFNHQPKDVPRLLKPIINNEADLVIGSRYIKGGGMHLTEAGTFQFLASKYGNLLVNKALLQLPINESLSGFLAFKRSIFKGLDLKKIFTGYGEYCISLLYNVYKKGFRINEVSVVYGKRQYGQSKSKLLLMTIDYFKTAIKLKFF
ncbi:MAG: polyprenol monophosphomannose synthase [Candidatus Beckwithbacteria bacterium]